MTPLLILISAVGSFLAIGYGLISLYSWLERKSRVTVVYDLKAQRRRHDVWL